MLVMSYYGLPLKGFPYINLLSKLRYSLPTNTLKNNLWEAIILKKLFKKTIFSSHNQYFSLSSGSK